MFNPYGQNRFGQHLQNQRTWKNLAKSCGSFTFLKYQLFNSLLLKYLELVSSLNLKYLKVAIL
jgi:hypothetical protein